MNTKKSKILAINYGGIGDEILFFPTLQSIKDSFPSSTLTLVTEPRSKSAKTLTDLIDNLITCDIKGRKKFINILKLLLVIWSKKYDLVVSSGSSKFVSIILFLTGIKNRYGYYSGSFSNRLLTKPAPLNRQQYAAGMYHDLVKTFLPEATYTMPEVKIKLEDEAWAKSKLPSNTKKTVLIHPGVSLMSIRKKIIKFWDTENWVELIKKLLISQKYNVVLVGGPDDGAVISLIREEIYKQHIQENNFIDLFGQTSSISQLAALIKLSDIMVCVDSAPMHIAVGTNTKTVALFGPTDEKKLLPDNDRFIAVINKDAKCRPCLWDKRQFSCERRDCLNISTEDVFNNIENFVLNAAVQKV